MATDTAVTRRIRFHVRQGMQSKFPQTLRITGYVT